MEGKRITIYDIASEVGVSPSLVSRVVSGNGSVSDKTRKKIQDVIDKYNFRPNEMARGLQKSRTRLIGFMIPHIGNEYFSNVYYEFEKHASENGYMTILYNGKNDPGTEQKILRVFDEVRVEAAVIMGGNVDAVALDAAYVEAINTLNRRVPCILCSEQAEKFGCVGVHMDTARKAELIAEYLHRKGYRTLGLLGGAASGEYRRYPTTFLHENLKHYAKEYGIEIREEWIHGNSYDERDGETAMQELLGNGQLPRAVCCINDHVAYGAMLVAKDAGLRIPEDMAVIGNDNVHIAGLARPSLTTVAVDFEQMGRLIFEKIVERLRGGETSSQMIEPVLIERDSA
ncbi:MAG: LacI family transcriptional regulator [Lachnospiraceae bacterium]|nr:LacI family transcriptional regulator [Lachnospiraceae bacterium]